MCRDKRQRGFIRSLEITINKNGGKLQRLVKEGDIPVVQSHKKQTLIISI